MRDLRHVLRLQNRQTKIWRFMCWWSTARNYRPLLELCPLLSMAPELLTCRRVNQAARRFFSQPFILSQFFWEVYLKFFDMVRNEKKKSIRIRVGFAALRKFCIMKFILDWIRNLFKPAPGEKPRYTASVLRAKTKFALRRLLFSRHFILSNLF